MGQSWICKQAGNVACYYSKWSSWVFEDPARRIYAACSWWWPQKACGIVEQGRVSQIRFKQKTTNLSPHWFIVEAAIFCCEGLVQRRGTCKGVMDIVEGHKWFRCGWINQGQIGEIQWSGCALFDRVGCMIQVPFLFALRAISFDTYPVTQPLPQNFGFSTGPLQFGVLVLWLFGGPSNLGQIDPKQGHWLDLCSPGSCGLAFG